MRKERKEKNIKENIVKPYKLDFRSRLHDNFSFATKQFSSILSPFILKTVHVQECEELNKKENSYIY